MQKKISLILMLCTGLLIASISVFIYMISLDLAHNTLATYLQHDASNEHFWFAIGLPVLVGIYYIAAPAFCLYAKCQQLTGIHASFVMMSLLLIMHNGLGFLSLIVAITSFIVHRKYERQ